MELSNELIPNNKVYFPNLNGLRFIAAFVVIIHHLEQLKQLLGLSNAWKNPFVNNVGKLGVILFFVLSGFLITYLLLKEEFITKSISIKNFYIRRILRIWPLYYVLLLLSFFVFPHIAVLEIPSWSANLKTFPFFVLFMPKCSALYGSSLVCWC